MLAANADGTAAAAWQLDSAFVSIYHPGAGWSEPTEVDSLGILGWPRLGLDAAGRTVLVLGSSSLGVFFSETADGTNWSATRKFDDFSYGEWDVAVAANGSTLAIWTTQHAGHDLYAQVSPAR